MVLFRGVCKLNRVTTDQLKAKILSHNAWHKIKLDVSSLGASGGMGEHLIILGTQTKISVLKNKTELWYAIDEIQSYESAANNTLKTPDKIWYEKYLAHKKTMGDDF